jgi:hypothetical protein
MGTSNSNKGVLRTVVLLIQKLSGFVFNTFDSTYSVYPYGQTLLGGCLCIICDLSPDEAINHFSSLGCGDF